MSTAALQRSQPAKSQPTSNASHASLLLQRKCACGSPTVSLTGECAECASKKRLQTKLTIGASNDPLELEADRVADQVMAAPACSAVGRAPPRIHRYSLHRDGQLVAPPIVDRTLASPGRPMEPGLRRDMEQRFGSDFSQVRVHVGELASQSAQEVGASAYTVGSTIVFGAQQFSPATHQGRKLIAHELTHVVQQSGRGAVYAHGDETLHGLHNISTTPTSPVGTLFRRGVPPPPQVLPQQSPPVGAPGGPLPTPGPAQRYIPELSKGSLEWLFARASAARSVEDARFFLETPVATLTRGGAAPDFVSESKEERVGTVGDKPEHQSQEEGAEPDPRPGTTTVKFKPRLFHVLDAIVDDINKVTSSVEFIWVYQSYFPDSFLKFQQRRDAFAQAANKPAHFTHLEKMGPRVLYNPNDFDPGGIERTIVFMEESRKRIATNPSLSTDQLAKALIEELERHETAVEERAKEKEEEGPCLEKEVDRRGGNPDHNKYADQVTGQTEDYLISAPPGGKDNTCQTDGRMFMAPRVVWEVKTRHEWATSHGMLGAIFAPRIQQRVNDIEEQKDKCLRVTSRCGLQYKYAFQTKEAADFMKIHWGNKPPVVHIA